MIFGYYNSRNISQSREKTMCVARKIFLQNKDSSTVQTCSHIKRVHTRIVDTIEKIRTRTIVYAPVDFYAQSLVDWLLDIWIVKKYINLPSLVAGTAVSYEH